MKHKRPVSQRINLILIVLLTAACVPAQPEIALAPPTATPAPPTATTAPTDTPEPTEIPALNPSARGYVSMTYDSESDKIILFGGYDEPIGGGEPIANGETWAYDVASNTWTNMKPTSGPPENGGTYLVYDIESDRVILFNGGWFNNDTWAYDYNTNTWTEMANGPKSRMGYRMAYDAESDRCILFGGLPQPPGVFNETYAYDFNSDTWTKMEPSISPQGRNFHTMAYDPQADRVILFGGGDWKNFMEDTWAYDYNTDTWEEIIPSDGIHPSQREGHAMVYDNAAGWMLLYGGSIRGSETWSFETSTSTWTLLEPVQTPGRRKAHAMAYSSTADLVILYGGEPGGVNFDFTDQTWSFDLNSNTWTNLTRSP
jgi:hypothetical protein